MFLHVIADGHFRQVDLPVRIEGTCLRLTAIGTTGLVLAAHAGQNPHFKIGIGRWQGSQFGLEDRL